MTGAEIQNKELYGKVKVMGNQLRFLVIELTQEKEMSISEISKTLNLSYTKCADYIRLLESEGLIKKRKEGKEVFVTSKTTFNKDKIEFK